MVDTLQLEFGMGNAGERGSLSSAAVDQGLRNGHTFVQLQLTPFSLIWFAEITDGFCRTFLARHLFGDVELASLISLLASNRVTS